MKTPPMTRVQSRTVVSGGPYGPEGLTAFLPTMTLGLTELISPVCRANYLLNSRGRLSIAPSLFQATSKIINFAWFSSLSKHRGAATSSMKMGRVSFFLQVREQVSNDALKALHSFQNSIFFAFQHSEGEMECGSRNQGMRCQK